MDGGDRRQSQYGTPYQPSRPGRPAPGQPMGPPSHEHYSQTASSPSRTANMATASTARSYMPTYQYGYQETPYQPQLQYQPSYVQDTRSQSLQSPTGQPQYATYGHGSMLPPVGQQSMYETIPQYQQQQQQQRQAEAIQVMAGQFNTLQQYMPSNESGTVGVGQPPSQYLSSQPEPQSYSMSLARPQPQLQPPFAPSPAEYGMIEQPPVSQGHDEASTRQVTEDGRRQYDQQLRATFDAIHAGRVSEASEKLRMVTEWLVGSIRALGLHHDDEAAHDQRILFWRELNHAWEGLGLKQKSITEDAFRNQIQPRDILSAAAITSLIDHLVQQCDQLEKYGLVDYEMGIWEEQITSIFIQCLDLLPRDPGGSDSGIRER